MRLLIGIATAFFIRLNIRARRKLICLELAFDSLFFLLFNKGLLLRIRSILLWARIGGSLAKMVRIFDRLRAFFLITEANLFKQGIPKTQFFQLRFFCDLLIGRWIRLNRRFYAWITQIWKFSVKLLVSLIGFILNLRFSRACVHSNVVCAIHLIQFIKF